MSKSKLQIRVPGLAILLITFNLAFCSIVYELLLSQLLSVFLGNTVMRYSITIGLYMFSLGIGAFLAEGEVMKNPVLTLLKTEIFIILLGGLSLIMLHEVNALSHNMGTILSIFSHLLIILIGVLSGLELPALMEIQRQRAESSETLTLGLSYIGAFTGTIVFAFWFYPEFGLMASTFFVAMVNAITVLMLITQTFGQQSLYKRCRFWFSLHLILFVIFTGAWLASSPINSHFRGVYLSV